MIFFKLIIGSGSKVVNNLIGLDLICFKKNITYLLYLW
jgi:hypothetical protein